MVTTSADVVPDIGQTTRDRLGYTVVAKVEF